MLGRTSQEGTVVLGLVLGPAGGQVEVVAVSRLFLQLLVAAVVEEVAVGVEASPTSRQPSRRSLLPT